MLGNLLQLFLIFKIKLNSLAIMFTNFKKTSRQIQNHNTQRQNHNSQRQNQLYISCVFHQNQTITNFCCNKECLLPMCPVCVAMHSEQHRQEKTHGEFLSILQVVENVQNIIIKQCRYLQELSQQYTQDYWNKQKMIESCKNKLLQSKKKIIREVQKQFDQVFYELNKKSNEFHDNVHDKYKQLQSEIQYLYESLKTQMEDYSKQNQKILKNVIRFYSQQKQQRIQEWCSKFKRETQTLRTQALKFQYNRKLNQVLESIPSFFQIRQFKDVQNQYLLSTVRNIIPVSPNRRQNESHTLILQKSSQTTFNNNNQSTRRNVLVQKQYNNLNFYDNAGLSKGTKIN